MGICNGISAKWLFIHCFQIELVSIFVEGGKPENPVKNPRSKDQQQTQSTYDAGSGKRTRDTLVEGECSHHYTIPAAPSYKN